MSRIRHAGGNITVTTKGKETTYAKGNIELHSNKKVNSLFTGSVLLKEEHAKQLNLILESMREKE